jgi:hypothetical protein
MKFPTLSDPYARDGHRFESPQLHHEVRANRRYFPGSEITRAAPSVDRLRALPADRLQLRQARPRLAGKPSHQHTNNPRHCGNRCPKCPADVGTHLLFLALPLNFPFAEPTQGEQPLWARIDARTMTDRVEYSTFPVGFKLGAPRGLLLQVCHGASRKVSTVPQLDDDTLPQQWQSNRSVRSLFHGRHPRHHAGHP